MDHFTDRKGFTNLLARHSLSMAVHFIWTERNNRLLQNKQKPTETLSHEAISQIRLLLMNLSGIIPERIQLRWNI